METTPMVASVCVALMAGGWAAHRIQGRLLLSRAKAPSLAGHVRWSKRIAGWLRAYDYDSRQWFSVDGAPAAIASQRAQALAELGRRLRERSPQTLAVTAQAKAIISDLQFTSHLRVPFQFRQVFQQHVQLGAFLSRSEGSTVTDLDGQSYLDTTGSYGVNLFGTEFYKQCIDEGAQLARALGPVLGAYHPCVLDNVQRLKALSGQDEVSFHMSGTEAVMQAVRMARYHSGRRKIVRFAGAYHGWWDDVQPGPGNPMPPAADTLTLREMHENTLKILRRRSDIACVLINPLQALHPNRAAPSDSTLVGAERRAHYDRVAYTRWLQELREICTERGIALILDEVFLGFRLGITGAQGYFGIQADLVTYGKTLGGGLPIGVVCGQSRWMRRFKDDRPGDICFARGTFNAHPYVMASMNVFLKRLQSPAMAAHYARQMPLWTERRERLNQRLEKAGHPVRFEGMETVWTLTYQRPSRYNWLLQFYLREQGVALSWVGTGRFIFNFGFGEDDVERFEQAVLTACARMAADGWWWVPEGVSQKQIQRQVLKELLNARWWALWGSDKGSAPTAGTSLPGSLGTHVPPGTPAAAGLNRT